MTNFASLLDKRRDIQEDRGQPQHQMRSRYAQHAIAEPQNVNERQQMEQLQREYRQHNIGSPQATLGQMEDWQRQRQQQQGQNQTQQTPNNPHADRDWDVSMRQEQARERTQANNRGQMQIERPKQARRTIR